MATKECDKSILESEMQNIKFVFITYGQIIQHLAETNKDMETGTKDSPKSGQLVATLTWKCQELSISCIRISLAIPLSLRHALKNSYSLEREKKTRKPHSAELTFWLWNTHFSTIRFFKSPVSSSSSYSHMYSYSQSTPRDKHVIAVSSRKSQKWPICFTWPVQVTLAEALEIEIRWYVPQESCLPSAPK